MNNWFISLGRREIHTHFSDTTRQVYYQILKASICFLVILETSCDKSVFDETAGSDYDQDTFSFTTDLSMQNPLTIETSIDEIVENFSFLDDWEDRYGYLIELGNALSPMADEELNESNKVQGCVSQVWLVSEERNGLIHFNGMSDAHIVRGLVAIALSIFSGKTPNGILAIDEDKTFQEIGLSEHITPQRANGLKSMVQRIKTIAKDAAT